MSAFRADALMASPSWKSMARTVLLSRRVLKRPFGSFSWAPFGNVSLTAFLRVSPMQTMPSWDQTGTPSGREGFFHFTSSITPGSAPLIRARSWPSLSPLQPAVFRTMASICWDADASFMPMPCCGGSAPSGRKGSVPCPFDACSQANNTPPLSFQQFGPHSLDVLAPRFCFLRREHPADPLIAGKRGEVFPSRQNLWAGNQDASQVRRYGMGHSAGDNRGTHRSSIVAPMRTKAALGSARRLIGGLAATIAGQRALYNRFGVASLAACCRLFPAGMEGRAGLKHQIQGAQSSGFSGLGVVVFEPSEAICQLKQEVVGNGAKSLEHNGRAGRPAHGNG